MRPAVRIANATALFVLALAITSLVIALPSKTEGASTNGAYFNYLVVIVLENRPISETYGSRCTGNCSYITQLANDYGLAERYSAVTHDSLPNYLALTSAWTQKLNGTVGDCSPFPSSTKYCPTVNPQLNGAFPFAVPNIVDRIESARLNWKAYMEDYPSTCAFPDKTYCSSGECYEGYGGTSSLYDNEHNPLVYYADITNNTSRCARIVPSDSETGYPDDLFINDLFSTTSASNLMWLIPDLCDDGHNLCKPLNNTVSQQNDYLSDIVPQILNSPLFRTQRSALFITEDEGTHEYPTDYVTSIWAGPVVKSSFKSSAQYSHYSLLRTIESNWGLQPMNQTTDGEAASMSEFFSPAPPQSGVPISPLASVSIVTAGIVIAVGLLIGRRKTKLRKPMSG